MRKILIFNDAKFPEYKKIKNIDSACVCCDRKELSEQLNSNDFDVFVNTHGEFFPAECVDDLLRFLETGKGFLNMGGIPLRFPVFAESLPEGEKYKEMRKLNIHTYAEVKTNEAYIKCEYPFLADEMENILEKGNSKSITWVATKSCYEENIWGSVGPMDITVKSVITGINEKDEKVISYGSLIENRGGKYEGGRWLLITGNIVADELDYKMLKNACEYISFGRRKCTMLPGYGCYKHNEQPVIHVTLEQNKKLSSWIGVLSCFDIQGSLVFQKEVEFSESIRIQKQEIAISGCEGYGRYTVKIILSSADGETIEQSQGFYRTDGKPLNRLEKLKCGKDYFYKDGKVFPINGTTYMSDEVNRQFLLYPNPEHWYQDMKEMKRQGINWVRTGLWCNWRRYMWDDGQVEEAVLRAFDAFLMAAHENEIYVTFNFFAFVPEAWEGTNPYLDERSLKAQENFIGAFVSRCKGYTGIDWDLINEPYVFDHPLTKKSSLDTLEQKYFSMYLKEKYKGDLKKAITKLDLPVDEIFDFSDIKLPAEKNINFTYVDMAAGKIGTIWREYQLFMTDVFCKWTRRMKKWIQNICPDQMVTVGQDEAVYTPRITNLEFGSEIDYTAQHPWWKNSSLLLAVKTAKYPEKPLVLQETGVMYSEGPDGARRRTEEEKALLIQRKFAYSFGCSCAGTIQWLWNTNYYMANANESSIGAVRADGTYKPEMKIFSKMRKFLENTSTVMSDTISNSQIAVLYPFSSIYSNRRYGMKGIMNSTYVLGDILKYNFELVSEYELEILEKMKPEYIIIPSAHLFETRQFEKLLSIIGEIGSTVIFTGPVSINEYGKPDTRMNPIKGYTESKVRSLQKFEAIEYGGKEYHFLFGTDYSETAYAEEFSGKTLSQYAIGRGQLICIGIPIELSENLGEIASLYQVLMDKVSVCCVLKGKNTAGAYFSKILWENGNGYCLINESGQKVQYQLEDTEINKIYCGEIEAGEIELFATDKTGEMISVYGDKGIACQPLS